MPTRFDTQNGCTCNYDAVRRFGVEFRLCGYCHILSNVVPRLERGEYIDDNPYDAYWKHKMLLMSLPIPLRREMCRAVKKLVRLYATKSRIDITLPWIMHRQLMTIREQLNGRVLDKLAAAVKEAHNG